MIFLATGKTHVGKRESNEDAYLYTENLFVVADGMGGHAAGEIASALAAITIEMAMESLTHQYPAHIALHAAMNHANKAIFKKGRSSPEYKGLGTTVVAIHFKDGANDPAGPVSQGSVRQGAVAHAGDSRAYRLREGPGGSLEQLTKDHAVAGQGLFCSLGDRPKDCGDIKELDFQHGDVFLLCSDGMHVLPTDRITEILRSGGGADELVAATIALELEDQDNVTAIVVRVLEGTLDTSFDEVDI